VVGSVKEGGQVEVLHDLCCRVDDDVEIYHAVSPIAVDGVDVVEAEPGLVGMGMVDFAGAAMDQGEAGAALGFPPVVGDERLAAYEQSERVDTSGNSIRITYRSLMAKLCMYDGRFVVARPSSSRVLVPSGNR
jgi:hypothetical protein